jgi:hypothetical protein
MVKVISDAPVTSRETVCTECGYKLSYNKIDVKKQTVVCFDESETIYWIVCPQCKNNTSVKPWF